MITKLCPWRTNATKVGRRGTLILRYVPTRSHPSPSQPRLRIPSAAVKHEQFSFRALSNSCPKLWNALLQTIKEADSSSAFRRRLKRRLFFGRTYWLCTVCLFFILITVTVYKFILCYVYLLQRSEHSG